MSFSSGRYRLITGYRRANPRTSEMLSDLYWGAYMYLTALVFIACFYLLMIAFMK